jgi:pimeloyl-ACP methyl ester carboxylesterase
MALENRGARLVLVAPLTSTVDLATHAVGIPILPMSFVMVDRFDTIAKAPRIQTPALVVHGDIDDIVPVEMGERVAKALPHGRFVKVLEGRHDDLYKRTSVIGELAAHAGEDLDPKERTR